VSEPKASEWERAAHHALRDRGHRAGGARAAVVGVLAVQDCCLSAREIASRLHRQGNDVGLASIYRALDLLSELGLVARVDIGEGAYRYEPVAPTGEHHHHAVCGRCGRVTAFEDEGLERNLERLAGRLRHQMSGHEIVIHGECSRCSRK
jgi:Fur family transcriptional regulator, ferric uptake regulator